MTTKERIHQANLSKWAILCKEQADSGLTVRQWCTENNLSIHAYNYWKHKLKLAAEESAMPDIVSLPIIDVASSVINEIPEDPSSCDLIPDTSYELSDSRSSSEVTGSAASSDSQDSISISFKDIHLQISSSASDSIISEMIGVIRHA